MGRTRVLHQTVLQVIGDSPITQPPPFKTPARDRYAPDGRISRQEAQGGKARSARPRCLRRRFLGIRPQGRLGVVQRVVLSKTRLAGREQAHDLERSGAAVAAGGLDRADGPHPGAPRAGTPPRARLRGHRAESTRALAPAGIRVRQWGGTAGVSRRQHARRGRRSRRARRCLGTRRPAQRVRCTAGGGGAPRCTRDTPRGEPPVA